MGRLGAMSMARRVLLAPTWAIVLLLTCAFTGPEMSLQHVVSDPDFVEITDGPAVQLDLRYATTNNFTHTDLYGGFHRTFLRREGAAKFSEAQAILAREHPGWKFLIWDALRPRSVQREFWKRVVGTPQEKYVANPDPGSIHNFGLAIDLTLIDDQGVPIDMGTDFDDFSKAAEPLAEQDLLKSGRLTPAQLANRMILRDIMTRAGFIQLPEEWWHYDALPGAIAKTRFSIVE
jgi:D-alanyl-D-alanine dipeptidase